MATKHCLWFNKIKTDPIPFFDILMTTSKYMVHMSSFTPTPFQQPWFTHQGIQTSKAINYFNNKIITRFLW
jgi:hypothetical protein